MLEFLKRQINLIIIIFLIPLLVIFVDKMTIRAAGDPEDIQDQSKTSEAAASYIYADDSKDIDGTGFAEPEIGILDDGGIGEEIPGDNGNIENLTVKAYTDEEITKEGGNPRKEERLGSKPEIEEENDNEEASVSEEIKDETNEYSQNGYQDVDFTSSEDFRIEVDLSLQRVFIYYKDSFLREMVCSAGTAENPTPLGEFTTNEKIKYSWIPRFDVGAYYWVRFYGSYLFHSVPFDKDGNMIMEEKEKLGSPASHGCIRLRLDEAKWLYDNLPLGVKVLIYPEKS